MHQTNKHNIIIGVTGASGALYAKQLFLALKHLHEQLDEVAILFSDKAKDIWEYEIGDNSWSNVPFTMYDNHDFLAPFASGSSNYKTMIICPCSMGTLGRIACGTSDNLIIRSADVMLKERRKLILVPRETPYNLIHIKNMETITLAGGIICPASPHYYSKPETIENLANTVIERILTLAGFNFDHFKWGK